jgi:cytochrome c-type biogenesis protein CcmI
MTVWVMIAGLAVALLVGLYIFWPYFEPERRRQTSFVGRDPKEALMAELAQLEYDFRSGKLHPEDYEQLRMDLEAQLLKLQAQGSRREEASRDAQGGAGAG